MYACMYTCMYYVGMYLRVCKYVYVCMYVCMYVCLFTCISLCVYACMYIIRRISLRYRYTLGIVFHACTQTCFINRPGSGAISFPGQPPAEAMVCQLLTASTSTSFWSLRAPLSSCTRGTS